MTHTPGVFLARVEPAVLRFRRHRDADIWHFHKECADWPLAEYETAERPRLGFVCPECKARRTTRRPWIGDPHATEMTASAGSPRALLRR